MHLIFLFIGMAIVKLFYGNKKEKKENFVDHHYNMLKNNWSKIFPDGNRNAAGPKFFKYILDQNPTYNDFLELNKLYCAVSGSLISEGSDPSFVKVREENTSLMICGNYYKCCWPCICDLMKYAKVVSKMHKFNGDTSPRKIYLLVINNPCYKQDFPSEVNKGYFCNKDNSLDTNQVFSVNGKLVIGLLHDAKVCSKEESDKIDNDQISGIKCRERNSTPLNKLNYGMGDIFIKMAK